MENTAGTILVHETAQRSSLAVLLQVLLLADFSGYLYRLQWLACQSESMAAGAFKTLSLLVLSRLFSRKLLHFANSQVLRLHQLLTSLLLSGIRLRVCPLPIIKYVLYYWRPSSKIPRIDLHL
jgi:hypothetical protein